MFEEGRKFLKADAWKSWKDIQSGQQKGEPIPPVEKAVPAGSVLIDLVAPSDLVSGEMPVREAIAKRQSLRTYSADSLGLEEISFLLWATQGVREVLKDGTITRRTVPSGGSRQPFETYLLINRVGGIVPGLYRYQPLEHQLCFLYVQDDMREKVIEACHGQRFVADAAAVFFWAAVPYRMEWRYTIASHKVIALEGGHLCQNLYMAAESINAGCCAVAAYDQQKVDAFLGLDGEEEFCIYLAPVGKRP